MKNQQTWFAADVSLAPAAVEAVEFALSEAGAGGTEYSTLGVREIGETVTVTGYFSEAPDLQAIESEIKDALEIYDLPAGTVKSLSVREVENRDWLAEWKKNWRPTVTEKFIIAPVWSEIETVGKTIIRIEPSMAFGTGTHETTRLCLNAIEKNYQGESFFDVGTGTGILAIAAVKLATENTESTEQQDNSAFSVNSVPSVAQILACDTDEDSIEIARENAELNAARNIEFYVGTIEKETPQFDFVCANLTADVIVPLLSLLIEKTGKTLLLSGILREQEDWVASELQNLGISNYELQTDGEWISIQIEKSK